MPSLYLTGLMGMSPYTSAAQTPQVSGMTAPGAGDDEDEDARKRRDALAMAARAVGDDQGMIKHPAVDDASRQGMPAPAEVQRLTPNAVPAYRAATLQRAAQTSSAPSWPSESKPLQRIVSPGTGQQTVPPNPEVGQAVLVRGDDPSGEVLLRIPDSGAAPAPQGVPRAPSSETAREPGATLPRVVPTDQQARISDRIGRDVIAYADSQRPRYSELGQDLVRIPRTDGAGKMPALPGPRPAMPRPAMPPEPAQAFSDRIGQRVQEYAVDQRPLDRIGEPSPVTGTGDEPVRVPESIQRVVLPQQAQQALADIRNQGPPPGQKGVLGRLREMGKGALLGIESGRGAIPGAIVGAADPDELERERYYTQTLPRAEKLAASEAAEQQEELKRAAEVAGQTGVYPETGQKTVASAYKDAMLGLGRDRLDIQRKKADVLAELGWARIRQGDDRNATARDRADVQHARALLGFYKAGGELTDADRQHLKSVGIDEELPDQYDPTKVFVDPISGDVRFIKPRAATVKEVQTKPRPRRSRAAGDLVPYKGQMHRILSVNKDGSYALDPNPVKR